MAVRIVVDSTVDVNPKIADKISVVPMTVHFGDETYVQGVDITNQQFYEKLIESDVMPTTSQATPFAFEEVFREITDAGDTAVVITLSSKLSGTCQSAAVAAAEFPGKIWVVDSDTVTIGSGILAEYALAMADEGTDAAGIARELELCKGRCHVLAMLDTLEYLKRGGRISKATAFAGELLSIKPVVCVQEGQIQMLGKARGSKQGNNLLVQEIQKAGGVDFDKPLLLGYTGLSDVLLTKYMEDSKALWENGTDQLRTTLIGSVIGTHAGPGAVAVAFFSKNVTE